MVRIYVKTSTCTIAVANHRAKGGGCDINFLTFKNRGGQSKTSKMRFFSGCETGYMFAESGETYGNKTF